MEKKHERRRKMHCFKQENKSIIYSLWEGSDEDTQNYANNNKQYLHQSIDYFHLLLFLHGFLKL